MTQQPYSGNPYSIGYHTSESAESYYRAMTSGSTPKTPIPAKRIAPPQDNSEDFNFWWLEKIIAAEKTRERQAKERA